MVGRKRSLEEIVYKRGNILCAIDDQSRAKPALTEAVGTSRSTIDRGVNELEKVGCIERWNGTYRTTLLGELSCEHYRQYQANVGALDKAKDLVERLPGSARLSLAFLRGADIRIAHAAAPEAALQPAIERLASAEQLRGFAPVGITLYVDLLHEYANINGLSTEIIVQNEALRPIVDLDRERLRELVTKGHLEIFVVEEPLYYALWIMESAERIDTGAAVYENGGICGHLMNSSPEAVEWADNEYDRRREQAEQIPVGDLLDG